MIRWCGWIAFVTAVVACGSSSKSSTGAPDTTPPAIASTTPANGATAGASAKIAITFSEPMDTSTVAASASDGTNAYDLGAATWSSGNTQVSFDTPPSPLGFGKSYAVVVDGKDVAGNAMTQALVTFSVEAQPVVATVAPAAGANGVAVTNSISLGFNVAADHASVESALSVKSGDTPLTCDSFSWSADSTVVTCGHSAALGLNTTYAIDLAATAKSVLGDPIAPNSLLPSTFETAATADTTKPIVLGRDPSTDVAANNALPGAPITIVFSEPVDRSSATAAFSLLIGQTQQSGTFSWDATGTRMTFQPAAALPYGSEVAWTVDAGVKDTSGNASDAPGAGLFHVVKSGTDKLSVAGSGSVDQVISDIISYTVKVGDDGTGNNAPITGYLTFDLTKLSHAPVAIEKGQLDLQVWGISGDPSPLGTLWAQSVNYGSTLTHDDAYVPTDGYYALLCSNFIPIPFSAASVGESSAASSPSSNTAIPLMFCPYRSAFPATGWAYKSIQSTDVTRIVTYQWGDRTNRESRLQFRLAFQNTTDNDGVEDSYTFVAPVCPEACWQMTQPTLEVTYDYAW